jgi:glycosyltransferase involved in cell wall biosynthesis
MYNEEGNIGEVVSSARSVLGRRCDDFEIIVVNDGSRDRTREIAEEIAKQDAHIRVVNHDKNRGYGAALRSGFKACRFEIIFQADGDNQYKLEEIDRLLPFLGEYDFVVGYRIKRRDPFYRSLEALWYRFLLWLLFGLRLRDANCAFKIFKKRIMDQLKLESSGAIINGEIFVKARKLGFSRIKEVGVNHYPRRVGKQTGSKFKVLWEAWVSILRLWIVTRR